MLLHLIIQLHAVAMVARNSTVCASPLMRHALTAGRLRRLHSWLEVLTTLGEHVGWGGVLAWRGVAWRGVPWRGVAWFSVM